MLKTIQYYTPSSTTISNWWFGSSNRHRQKSLSSPLSSKDCENEKEKKEDKQCLLENEDENIRNENNLHQYEEAEDDDHHLDITRNHPLAILTNDDSEVDCLQLTSDDEDNKTKTKSSPYDKNDADTKKTITAGGNAVINKQKNGDKKLIHDFLSLHNDNSRTLPITNISDNGNNNPDNDILLLNNNNNISINNGNLSVPKTIGVDDVLIDSFTQQQQQQQQFPLSSDDEYRTCNELLTPTSSTTTFANNNFSTNKDDFVIINISNGYEEILYGNDFISRTSMDSNKGRLLNSNSYNSYEDTLGFDNNFISRTSSIGSNDRPLNIVDYRKDFPVLVVSNAGYETLESNNDFITGTVDDTSGNNDSRLLDSNYQLDDRVRQIILEGLSQTNDDDNEDGLPSQRQSRHRLLPPSALSKRHHEISNDNIPSSNDSHQPSCSSVKRIGSEMDLISNSVHSIRCGGSGLDYLDQRSSSVRENNDMDLLDNPENQNRSNRNSGLDFLESSENVHHNCVRRRSGFDFENAQCLLNQNCARRRGSDVDFLDSSHDTQNLVRRRRRSSDLHFMVNPTENHSQNCARRRSSDLDFLDTPYNEKRRSSAGLDAHDHTQNLVIRNIQHIPEYTDSDSSYYLEASSRDDTKSKHKNISTRRGSGILFPFSLIFNKNHNKNYSGNLLSTPTATRKRHTSPKKRRQRSGTTTAATPPSTTTNEQAPMLRVKTKSYGTSDDDNNERTLLYSGNRARIRSIQRIRDAADMASNDDSDNYPVVTVNTDFLSASYSQFGSQLHQPQRKSFSESSMQLSCYCTLNSSWSEYTISLPSTEVGSECKETDHDDENGVFATACLFTTDGATRHKAVSQPQQQLQQETFYMTGHHVKEIFLDDECFCCQCTIM